MSSKLSDKFRNEVSWNGFGSDVMKSGLQKYIRRGNIEKALFCAGELDLFKEAPDRGETIRTNFLHRLMVIYLEDVANLTIFYTIYQKLNEIVQEREFPQGRNKMKEEKLISDVVVLLCRSKKARICSHIRAVFNPKYNTAALLSKYPSIKSLWCEIEENKKKGEKGELEYNCEMFKRYLKAKNILAVYYAFQIDMSDTKLKTKIFGKSKPVWFIFKELINPFNQKTIEKFMSWFENHLGTIKENFLCWLVPLLSELSIIPEGEKVIFYEDEYCGGWERNRGGDKFEVDDFVVDRHTRKGVGKDLVEFAVNGAYVENEAEFVRGVWKQFYEDGKRWEEGKEVIGEQESPVVVVEKQKNEVTAPLKVKRKRPQVAPQRELKDPLSPLRETEEYEFIVRTQLNTSRNKQDVYFARDQTGKLVVVKGPYKDLEQINILRTHLDWKKENKLPYINFEVKEMIPDRWPEGVALGIRNTIDRTVKANFLIFDSVVFEDQIVKKKHSSKVWPETEVVDWEKIPLHFDYKARKLLEQEMIDYVHNLLFRYLFGISDLADRNFLMVNGQVISIDEEIEGKLNGLNYELKKNKCIFIQNWLKDNYEKLNVNKWFLIKTGTRVQLLKYEEITNKEYCLRLFNAL
jgi:hypothetical protein